MSTASRANFEIAADLPSTLESIDGFVSAERFESVSRPGRYLSLSYWRQGEAVRRWRRHALHRAARLEGRSEFFADCRLRVAAVVRGCGPNDRWQAPAGAGTGLL